jgi:Kef-type K+ transport system membrane component KefB
MQNVPPVAVDLILDPFLFNVFPRSLVPTAGWIVVVAVLAIFLGRWIVGEVGRVIDDARRQRSLEEMKKK